MRRLRCPAVLSIAALSIAALSIAAFFVLASVSVAQDAGSDPVRVALETSKGRIVLELYPDKAPKTVENFLQYVRDGHYDNTIVYRVESYLIQAGSQTPALRSREARDPIENEADNGLKNKRGTVGMARWAPHTADAEYYINTKDNPHLDFREKTKRGWGYCVFGSVVEGAGVVEGADVVEGARVEGMDVVDAIAALPTRQQGNLHALPQEEVLIKTVRVVGEESLSPSGDQGGGTSS